MHEQLQDSKIAVWLTAEQLQYNYNAIYQLFHKEQLFSKFNQDILAGKWDYIQKPKNGISPKLGWKIILMAS